MVQKPKIESFKKHKFEEERARRVLMYCFPEKYCLARLSESPDIIVTDSELSIGVEVTESMIHEIQQNMSRASNITGKRADELSSINRKNISCGYVVAQAVPNGQHIAGFATWGDTHDLALAYMKKLKKLNDKHFTIFQENNLFIFSWMIDEDELCDGIQKILSYSSCDMGYQHKFHYVYIFKEDQLITIGLNSHQVDSTQIPSTVMAEISETSFVEIFGMTRKQYYSR